MEYRKSFKRNGIQNRIIRRLYYWKMQMGGS